MVRGCAIPYGTFFMIDSGFIPWVPEPQKNTQGTGFMGMFFEHFPDLWVWFFVKIHILVNCFGISGFMGMIFSKFSRFKCTLLRNLPRFMGGTFTI